MSSVGNTNAHREVPTEALRRALEMSGITAAELARRLGWMRPDSMRVNRQLGVIPGSNGHGYGSRRRETVTLERAYEILEALGVDPVDVDL